MKAVSIKRGGAVWNFLRESDSDFVYDIEYERNQNICYISKMFIRGFLLATVIYSFFALVALSAITPFITWYLYGNPFHMEEDFSYPALFTLLGMLLYIIGGGCLFMNYVMPSLVRKTAYSVINNETINLFAAFISSKMKKVCIKVEVK